MFVHVTSGLNVLAGMWVSFSALLQLFTQGQLLCTHEKVHEKLGA